MDHHSPTISVIIPTYNGAHRISNTLDAIIWQTNLPDEVVVIIDGSTDCTEEVVEKYTQKIRNLKIVRQLNMGRAAVRNTGAKSTDGKILVFYDDDTRPEPDSILRHKDFHLTQPSSICTGFPLEDEKLMKTDIQKYKHWLSIKWTEKYNSGANNLSEKNLFFTAANMSVTRDLFFQLGGFDERLTDAEDYEFAVRAHFRGTLVFFDKSNIAWHDDFITCRSYIRRQRQYNDANNAVNNILPENFRRKALNIHELSWPKRCIFWFFSLPVWVKWVDGEALIWIPVKWRYKIYDLIITSLGKYFPSKPLT